jgi:hypothetical protein
MEVQGKKRSEFCENQHRLKSSIAEVRSEIERGKGDFESLLEFNVKSDEKKISILEEEYRGKIMQARRELEGIVAFYEEKKGVLEARLAEAKGKYEERPSRECDLEHIDRLVNESEILLVQVKCGAKDIGAYKRLMAAREREYNSMFGRSPSVALAVIDMGYRRKPSRSRKNVIE